MEKVQCSVAILTLNNENTIKQCLESVSFCDDIVVLDGNSSDKTREIALECGARIFDQHEDNKKETVITSFTDMRIKSFKKTKHDWVFYLDSDEYISPELATAIQEIVTRNNPQEMGQFKRVAIVDGKIIDHAYYYPDWVDRLIHKKSGIQWKEGNRVHERLIIPNDIKKIHCKGKLFSYWPALKQCIQKDDYYQSLTVEKLKETAHNKQLASMWKGAWLNTLRAIKVLLLGLYLPLRYKNVLPFAYHMRFVRYNFKHAWSLKKWSIMIRAAWMRLPKALRVIVLLALIGRLLVGGVLIGLHGQANGFVYTVNGDAVEYANIAHNLAKQGIFSDQLSAPYPPQSWRTPGLPFILVALGGGWGWYIPTILLQILATTGLVLLVWFATKQLFNEKAAMCAAVLTAFEPSMLFWPNQILTEPLFMVLLFVVVNMLLKWIKKPESAQYAYAMALLAIATYIRQVSFFLLFVFPLLGFFYAMWKSDNLKQAYLSIGIGCLASALLLAPWYYRNSQAFGVTTFDVEFAGKGSIGKYLESYTRDKYGKMPVEVFKEELVQPDGTQNYEHLSILTLQTFMHDPLPFVKVGVLSTIPFFASDGWFTIAKTFNPKYEIASFDKSWTGTWQGLMAFVQSYIASGGAIFLIAKGAYVLLTLLAISGVCLALFNLKGIQKVQVTLLIVVVAYALVASGVASYARFRYPFSPFIFMFVGYAYAHLRTRKNV